MNIFQRLNEVRKAVSYLRKEKEVTGGGTYKVVTHDQVTAALREHLILHGVMIVPKLIRGTVVNTGTTTGKGIPIIRYEAAYEIDFVNCEEPTDKVTVSIESHALDQGDKAPGKAISYATKYAMLKLFSIETGEDEEERPEVKVPREKITANAGAMDHVSPDRLEFVKRTANSIIDCFIADDINRSYQLYYENKDIKDNEEKLAIWANLDSGLRRNLKQMYRDKLRGIPAKEKETEDVV